MEFNSVWAINLFCARPPLHLVLFLNRTIASTQPNSLHTIKSKSSGPIYFTLIIIIISAIINMLGCGDAVWSWIETLSNWIVFRCHSVTGGIHQRRVPPLSDESQSTAGGGGGGTERQATGIIRWHRLWHYHYVNQMLVVIWSSESSVADCNTKSFLSGKSLSPPPSSPRPSINVARPKALCHRRSEFAKAQAHKHRLSVCLKQVFHFPQKTEISFSHQLMRVNFTSWNYDDWQSEVNSVS